MIEAVRIAARGGRSGSRRGGALRPRDDRRHERPARGPHRAHGTHRDRRLHRRDRARPPGPARALPALPAQGHPRWSRPRCAFAAPERMGPDGPLRALDPRLRPRPRRGDRPGEPAGGGRLAAPLLRASRPRAPVRGAPLQSCCPASMSPSRTISSAPSASTSARRRPPSTRPSRRCWAAIYADFPPTPAQRGCRHRRSCSPPAGSPVPSAQPAMRP